MSRICFVDCIVKNTTVRVVIFQTTSRRSLVCNKELNRFVPIVVLSNQSSGTSDQNHSEYIAKVTEYMYTEKNLSKFLSKLTYKIVSFKRTHEIRHILYYHLLRIPVIK